MTVLIVQSFLTRYISADFLFPRKHQCNQIGKIKVHGCFINVELIPLTSFELLRQSRFNDNKAGILFFFFRVPP